MIEPLRLEWKSSTQLAGSPAGSRALQQRLLTRLYAGSTALLQPRCSQTISAGRRISSGITGVLSRGRGWRVWLSVRFMTRPRDTSMRVCGGETCTQPFGPDLRHPTSHWQSQGSKLCWRNRGFRGSITWTPQSTLITGEDALKRRGSSVARLQSVMPSLVISARAVCTRQPVSALS